LLLRRPDLLVDGLLAAVELRDGLADEFLKVQGALFHPGVHLAVDEDTPLEVLLRQRAEGFVLGHDALVHAVDEVEVLIAGFPAAVDFVADQCASGTIGDEALHEEELWPVGRNLSVCGGTFDGVEDAYMTFMEALGK